MGICISFYCTKWFWWLPSAVSLIPMRINHGKMLPQIIQRESIFFLALCGRLSIFFYFFPPLTFCDSKMSVQRKFEKKNEKKIGLICTGAFEMLNSQIVVAGKKKYNFVFSQFHYNNMLESREILILTAKSKKPFWPNEKVSHFNGLIKSLQWRTIYIILYLCMWTNI